MKDSINISASAFICNVFNSCNMGMSGLPYMYIRGLRVYISVRLLVPMLQLLHNTSYMGSVIQIPTDQPQILLATYIERAAGFDCGFLF